MEKKNKEVARSVFFYSDVQSIYLYGLATFGVAAADSFYDEIMELTKNLSFEFNLHPECRHLTTQSKKYRNIILGAYLIKYLVTDARIEVLRAIHSSRSPSYIRTSRTVRI